MRRMKPGAGVKMDWTISGWYVDFDIIFTILVIFIFCLHPLKKRNVYVVVSIYLNIRCNL